MKNFQSNHEKEAPYLKGLNEEQLKAVLHDQGPLLILAGAGSGKTRVITSRAVHLINSGKARPHNILGVTFTNKAANEMKERVKKALESCDSLGAGVPEFSTFHSFCLKLLRRHADLIGYIRPFAIFDDDDSGKLISKILKAFNLNEKIITPSRLKRFIENNKNSLVSPEESYGLVRAWEKDYAAVYAEYQKRLKESNAMDFGDLISNAVKLLKDNPAILEHYSGIYRYIMIDEFQDTNYIQDKLVRLLAGGHNNICVVGDDDQSIYSFRGATIDNILNFEKAYPGCSVIKLEKNYRSTRNILNAASTLVSSNRQRKDKTLKTDRQGGGSRITVYSANTDYSESYYVAKEIKRLIRQEGYYSKDIAVLYRANSQSRILEDRLIKESIKYNIYGGLKFYQRKEIKDILSFLRFAANPRDIVSFERSIQAVPIGIGEKTVKTMEETASKNGIDILSAYGEGLFSSFRGFGKSASKTDAANYFDIIAKVRAEIREVSKVSAEAGYDGGEDRDGNPDAGSGAGNGLAGIINHVYKASGYEAMLKAGASKADELDANRMDNIDELINAAHEFDDIIEFLDQSAINDSREETEPDGSTDITRVSLMTLHSAKGLEFPVVFIMGLEENLFPHARSMDDESGLEEERRLCYVGITRAKERLYLTWSKRRRSGKEYRYNIQSRFLEEIPAELTEEIEDAYEFYG